MEKCGRLFVVAGSSGVGKGTILKRFFEKNPQVKFSVSCTTRSPRPGEVGGVNYFFVTKEEFEVAINNDEFLEWAQFSGNYYGTKSSFVKETLAKGEDLVLEIETQGALQVMKKFPNAQYIFILPPSLEDLEIRLRGRGTESEEAIQKRLSAVKSELEISKKFTHCIINDNIDVAVSELQKIFDRK